MNLSRDLLLPKLRGKKAKTSPEQSKPKYFSSLTVMSRFRTQFQTFKLLEEYSRKSESGTALSSVLKASGSEASNVNFTGSRQKKISSGSARKLYCLNYSLNDKTVLINSDPDPTGAE
jgi:hypothetical protein